MMQKNCVLACALAVALVAVPVSATLVQQMDLATLCARSAFIVRGEVIAVTSTTVSVGGAQLPAVKYRVKVIQALKGSYGEAKGQPFAEFTMLGELKNASRTVGNAELRSPLAGVPQLTEGREYLLMVSPPSAAGLSATIGLGQGCFSIGDDKLELTVNETNNQGLMAGMGPGPIAYSALVNYIQNALAH